MTQLQRAQTRSPLRAQALGLPSPTFPAVSPRRASSRGRHLRRPLLGRQANHLKEIMREPDWWATRTASLGGCNDTARPPPHVAASNSNIGVRCDLLRTAFVIRHRRQCAQHRWPNSRSTYPRPPATMMLVRVSGIDCAELTACAAWRSADGKRPYFSDALKPHSKTPPRDYCSYSPHNQGQG